MKTILLLLIPIMSFAQGAFYDFNTEQFGYAIQQEFKISKPIRVLTSIRHQKQQTNIDLMLGRDAYYGQFNISMFIGLTLEDRPGATGITKISHYITDNIKASIYYQPTLNDNLHPYQWQHQTGININLEL